MTNLAVLLPTSDFVPAPLLGPLVHSIQNAMFNGFGVGMFQMRHSLIQESRERLLTQALETGAEYAIFVDSDMTFPPDGFVRLYNAIAKLPNAVAVSVSAMRKYPVKEPLGFKIDKTPFTFSDVGKGIQQASHLGFAFTIIRTAHLKKMSRPWFNILHENGQTIGEDYYFCGNAQHAGLEIWCECDLSGEIGHVGLFSVYNNDQTWEQPKRVCGEALIQRAGGPLVPKKQAQAHKGKRR